MWCLIAYNSSTREIVASSDVSIKKNHTVVQNKGCISQCNVVYTSDDLNHLQKLCDLDKCYVKIEKYGNINDVEMLSAETASASVNAAKRKKKKEVLRTHCCLFCGKLLKNLRRHLRYIHKDEPKVKEALTKIGTINGRNKRHTEFNELRKLGDEKYNQTNEKQDIIVVRNSRTTECQNYVVCVYCQGRYSRLNYKKHRQLCRRDKQRQLDSQGLSRVKAKRLSASASEVLKTYLFPSFKKEKQSAIIYSDPVCIIWGNFLCKKYHDRILTNHYVFQTNQLRLLADFLIIAKQLDPEINELYDLFHPNKFELIIKIIYKRAGYINNKFQHPTIASMCSTLIKQVCDELQCVAIGNKNKVLIKRYKNLAFLLQTRQNSEITKRAIENRTACQRSKFECLPTSNQVKFLFEVLSEEVLKARKNAERNMNIDTYCDLATSVLAYVMAFNRKRPGDIHGTTIDEYKNNTKVDESYMKNLTNRDKLMVAKSYCRFVTRGKLNKTASNLIHVDAQKALNLLIHSRDKVGIERSNIYLFANPKAHKTQHFRADICLRTICLKRKLPYKVFTATKLRKHLATVTAGLDKNTQNHISDFMGHSMQVHKSIYQIRQAESDIPEVGSILTEVSGLSTFHNPVISEITEENREARVPNVAWLEQDELDRTGHSEIEISGQIDATVAEPLVTQGSQKENSTLDTFKGQISDHSWTTLGRTESPLRYDSGNESSTSDTSEIVISKKDVHNLDITKIDRNPKRQIRARTWTTPERHTCRKAFSTFIENGEPPSVGQIYQILKQTADMREMSRTPHQIKGWICAEIQRRKKEQEGIQVNRWNTPRKMQIRQYFQSFYDKTIQTKKPQYPKMNELREAIRKVPAFGKLTPERIKSKLQHDFLKLQKNPAMNSGFKEGSQANCKLQKYKREFIKKKNPSDEETDEEEWYSSESETGEEIGSDESTFY